MMCEDRFQNKVFEMSENLVIDNMECGIVSYHIISYLIPPKVSMICLPPDFSSRLGHQTYFPNKDQTQRTSSWRDG